jgi:hypothetical protein
MLLKSYLLCCCVDRPSTSKRCDAGVISNETVSCKSVNLFERRNAKHKHGQLISLFFPFQGMKVDSKSLPLTGIELRPSIPTPHPVTVMSKLVKFWVQSRTVFLFGNPCFIYYWGMSHTTWSSPTAVQFAVALRQKLRDPPETKNISYTKYIKQVIKR